MVFLAHSSAFHVFVVVLAFSCFPSVLAKKLIYPTTGGEVRHLGDVIEAPWEAIPPSHSYARVLEQVSKERLDFSSTDSFLSI